MSKQTDDLAQAFIEGREVFLSPATLRALGLHEQAKGLKPGERRSSETGEVMYSADWLNDDQLAAV